jgi:hypothetical protein
VLAEQAKEARETLAIAFDRYLRQSAKSIIARLRRRGNIPGEIDPKVLRGEAAQ